MRVVIARQAGVLRDRLRQAVLGLGLECKATDCVSYDELPRRLSKEPVDLVLVGLGTDESEGLRVVAESCVQTAAPVFAVGLSEDTEHIRQALRSGAREHLHENDVREELLAALKKLRSAGIVTPHSGKVLAVTGALPGLGVTTIASNLAFALAGHYPGKVVLAELTDGVPQLALNLDLNPPRGLDALVAAWDRLDVTLLRRAIVNHPANLAVLAYPPETPAAADIPPAVARNLIVLLRSMYEFTVVDLGHALGETQQETLELADKVVVVLRLDVPALRLGRQFLNRMEELGVDTGRMHLIVNRYGQRQQYSWKKAQEAIGLTVAEWIPDDPAHVNKAVNFGKPLVEIARGAAITRRLANLAWQLNGKNKRS